MKAWDFPCEDLRPLCAADLFSVVLNGPRLAFPDPANPRVEILVADIRIEKEMLRSLDRAFRPPQPGKPRKSAIPELIAQSQRTLIRLHFDLKSFSVGVRMTPRGPVIPWPSHAI